MYPERERERKKGRQRAELIRCVRNPTRNNPSLSRRLRLFGPTARTVSEAGEREKVRERERLLGCGE